MKKKNPAMKATPHAVTATVATPKPETSVSMREAAKTSLKKMVSVWASMASTTATFAGMLLLTLAANKYVLHPLVEWFGADADPVVMFLFKAAKYLVLFVELAHWVYGVWKDCKHHHGDNDTH